MRFSLPFANKPKPNDLILVGTHHRAGAVWLASIFEKVSKVFSLQYSTSIENLALLHPNILFSNHSQFDFSSITTPYRGLHMIRDPRDVIVSACFYHCVAKEAWLHIPRKEFGGKTYQEKINSYHTFGDKLLFEMDNCSKATIDEMINWRYDNPNFMEIKYEDLITDTDLLLFHKLFSYLGFSGQSIPKTLDICYKYSIFSLKKSSKKNNAHIRPGAISQWIKYFELTHREHFFSLHEDALILLGYEKDYQWINSYSLNEILD